MSLGRFDSGKGKGARLSNRAGSTRFRGRSFGTNPPSGTPTKIFWTRSTNTASAVRMPPVAGTAKGRTMFANFNRALDCRIWTRSNQGCSCEAFTRMRISEARGHWFGLNSCQSRRKYPITLHLSATSQTGTQVFSEMSVIAGMNCAVQITGKASFSFRACHRYNSCSFTISAAVQDCLPQAHRPPARHGKWVVPHGLSRTRGARVEILAAGDIEFLSGLVGRAKS